MMIRCKIDVFWDDIKLSVSDLTRTNRVDQCFILACVSLGAVWLEGFLGNPWELDSNSHTFLCLVGFKDGNWNSHMGLKSLIYGILKSF